MKSIKRAEKLFDCEHGFRGAYFDIEGRHGPVRIVYVVYAAAGPDRDNLEDWFVNNVLLPLAAQGGKKLYWRNEEKIELKKEDGAWRIWARIAVLDDKSNLVTVPDMVKPEGEPMRDLP